MWGLIFIFREVGVLSVGFDMIFLFREVGVLSVGFDLSI